MHAIIKTSSGWYQYTLLIHALITLPQKITRVGCIPKHLCGIVVENLRMSLWQRGKLPAHSQSGEKQWVQSSYSNKADPTLHSAFQVIVSLNSLQALPVLLCCLYRRCIDLACSLEGNCLEAVATNTSSETQIASAGRWQSRTSTSR